MSEKQFQITAEGVQALEFLSKMQRGWLSVALAQDRVIKVQAELNAKNKATSYSVLELISLGQRLQKTYEMVEGKMVMSGKQVIVNFEEQARAAKKAADATRAAFVQQVESNRRALAQRRADEERGTRELQQLNDRLRKEEFAGFEQYNRWVEKQRLTKAQAADAEAKSRKELAELNNYFRDQEVASNSKRNQQVAAERIYLANQEKAAQAKAAQEKLAAEKADVQRITALREDIIERSKQAQKAQSGQNKQIAAERIYLANQEKAAQAKAAQEKLAAEKADVQRITALREDIIERSKQAQKAQSDQNKKIAAERIYLAKEESSRLAEIERKRVETQRAERKSLGVTTLAGGDLQVSNEYLRQYRGQLLNAQQAEERHNRAIREKEKAMKQLNGAMEENRHSLIQQIFHWETLVRVAAIHLMYRALGIFSNALNESINGTIKLQKSLSELQTVSQNASGGIESTAKWLTAIREQSSKFGTSLEDNIEGAYQGLSNQVIETTEDFRVFQTEVNRFAIATQSTTAQSVELLTSYINAFGFSIADVDKIAASAFKTIELGRVRANEMASSIGRILVPAAELGVTMDEVNALIALATLRGVKFSEAQTQIRGVLTKLIKPTDDMKALLASLGQESGEAAVKAFGFAGTMKLLADAVAGSSEATAKLFPDVRGLNLAFLLQGRGLEDYNKILKQTTESQTSYDRAVQYGMASTGKQLEIELTKARNFLKAEVGPQILEFLKDVTFGFKAIEPAAKATFSVIKAAVPALGLTAMLGVINTLIPRIEHMRKVAERAKVSLLSVAASKITPATGMFLGASALFLLFETIAAQAARSERLFQEKLDKAKQAVDEFGLRREKAISTLIEKENEYFDTIYRGYATQSAVISSGIQRELSERKLASAAIQKALDEDLGRAIDRTRNLAETTRKELNKTLSDIEANKKKIADLPGEQANTLFDWKLERLSSEDQYKLLTRRIKELQALRRAAVAEGATDQFESITKEIDSLVSKLGSISFKGEQSSSKAGNAQEYRDKVSRLERKRSLLLQDIEDAKTEKAREKLKLQLRNLDAQLESTRNKARSVANAAASGNRLSDKSADVQERYNALKNEELQLRYQILETQEVEASRSARRLKQQEARVKDIQAARASLDAFVKEDERSFKGSLGVTRASNNAAAARAALASDADPNSPETRSQAAVVRDAELNLARAKQQDLANQYDVQIRNAQKLREALRQTYSEEVADLQQKYAEMNDATERAFIGGEITNKIVEGRKKLAQLDAQIANFREQKALELAKIETEAEERRIAAIREEFQLREQAARKVFEEASNATDAGQKAIADLQKLIPNIDPKYRESRSPALLPPGVNILNNEKLTAPGSYGEAMDSLRTLFNTLKDENGNPKDIRDFSYAEIQAILNAYDKLKDKLKTKDDFQTGSQGAEFFQSFQDSIEALRKFNESRLARIQAEKEIKDIQTERRQFANKLETPDQVFLRAVDKFEIAIDKLIEKLGVTPAQGKANGGRVYGFSRGGIAPSDTIPAWLSPNEFVVNAKSTEKYFAQLMTINQGLTPRFQRQTGTSFNFGDIGITVNGKADGQALVNSFIRELQTRISTGAVKL